MAKQTFSVGQVLTAAQMTSLQQTAMGGGAASAKTANYVLVAADAGTTISMTSTSATTITVNTGLFAAGDTVFIQNLGSGTCTITAGTATVSTAGSLILPQYDAGILYFVSASSAIFYDYIQVGATSPLITKGDIYVYGSSDTRLPVGTNGYTLVADSAETTGLKWQAPAGGGGLTLLSTTTLSGATTTISSISGSYKDLFVVLRSVVNSASFEFRVKFNSATDKFYGTLTSMTDTALNGYQMTGTEHLRLAGNGAANDIWDGSFYITQYASSTYKKTVMGSCVNYYASSKYANNNSAVCFYDTTAVSSLTFSPNTGTFSSGTVLVYGVS